LSCVKGPFRVYFRGFPAGRPGYPGECVRGWNSFLKSLSVASSLAKLEGIPFDRLKDRLYHLDVDSS